MNKIFSLLAVFLFLPTVGKALTIPQGDGSAENPYRIASISDLEWLAVNVNRGTDFTDKYFLQTADLDFKNSDISLPEEGWTPIGGYRQLNGVMTKVGFSGIYDGNNHTIRNLFINRPNEDYQGLFGYSKGKIQNLLVEDASVTGKEYVAALCAYIFDNKIENCLVRNSSVNSSAFYVGILTAYNAWAEIQSSHVYGGKAEGVDYVGALVGWSNESKIYGCSATADIIGHVTFAGGLVGYLYSSSIANCSAHGQVNGHSDVGGLVGRTSQASVTQSFASGSVIGSSNVGGLIGRNESSSTMDCFAQTNVSGAEMVGGFVGYNTYGDGQIARCYAYGEVSADSTTYVGLFCGGLTGGSISSAFCRSTDSPYPTIGGVSTDNTECTPLTDDQFRNKASFTGWDFDSVWTMDSNSQGRPILRWATTEHGSVSESFLTEDINIMRTVNGVHLAAPSPINTVSVYSIEGGLISFKHQINSSSITVETGDHKVILIQVTMANGHVTTLKYIR